MAVRSIKRIATFFNDSFICIFFVTLSKMIFHLNIALPGVFCNVIDYPNDFKSNLFLIINLSSVSPQILNPKF